MSQSKRKKNCGLCGAKGHSIRTCGKAKGMTPEAWTKGSR